MQIGTASNIDTVYIVGKNVSATTMTTGRLANFCVAAGSAYGATGSPNMTISAAASNLWAGVAESDIAVNATGRIIIYGYAASVFISTSTGDCAFNNGEVLTPAAVGGVLSSVAPSGAASAMKFITALSVGVSVLGYCSGIVRGM